MSGSRRIAAVALSGALALALPSCTREPIDAAGPSPTPAASSSSPSPSVPAVSPRDPTIREYRVPSGEHPHDVAPTSDGRVWYTAQSGGGIGVLDPNSGSTRVIPLGAGSRPHGVIVGPDGAPWITDGGLNAIVRVDPKTFRARRFPVPGPNANLNTAAFDAGGLLWFTGQAGFYGKLDPKTGKVEVFDAPRGAGPYGMGATLDGIVWFASLAGSYIARIHSPDGTLTVVDVPTRRGGARRVWSDSTGRLWVTEWFAGKLARYDPTSKRWREWRLPGNNPQPYAVFVDAADFVWITDFGADSVVRFDPRTERFATIRTPSRGAEIRQLLGRPGEVWGAESATDRLVVLRTGS